MRPVDEDVFPPAEAVCPLSWGSSVTGFGTVGAVSCCGAAVSRGRDMEDGGETGGDAKLGM